MTAPNNKEILLLLREVRDCQIAENRADRLAEAERTITLLQGNLEAKEQRLRAMERYLKVEFEQSSKYIKNGK